MVETLAKMLEEIEKNPILTDKEAEDMQKTVKKLRKEKWLRD